MSSEEPVRDSEQKWLYEKYTVLKNGEPQDGCFVLKPESDPAALAALRTYADETDDPVLRSNLRGWIMAIDERNDRTQGTDMDRADGNGGGFGMKAPEWVATRWGRVVARGDTKDRARRVAETCRREYDTPTRENGGQSE